MIRQRLIKNFKDTPVASVMVETRLSRIVQSLRRFIERNFADFSARFIVIDLYTFYTQISCLKLGDYAFRMLKLKLI